jgi:hypothetical protein
MTTRQLTPRVKMSLQTTKTDVITFQKLVNR